MESTTLPLRIRSGMRQAVTACQNQHAKRRTIHSSTRCLAEPTGDIKAAAPFRFSMNRNPSSRSRSRPRAQLLQDDAPRRQSRDGDNRSDAQSLLRRIRVVPDSASYFTALPKHTDDILALSDLLRKYQLLPTATPEETPAVRWKTREDYRIELQEPVRAKSYAALVGLLKRLNKIHPSLIPAEVTEAMQRYMRLVQPHLNKPKPIVIDEFGRAEAKGRRKSSKATASLVDGRGECLINGRAITEYFGRLHDRESALWALKATQRLDKYNVWVTVQGGGTTGQAEAITLAVAKALLAHEPNLKPALRGAHVLTRDARRVERKKPGKLKARKMPAWVKR